MPNNAQLERIETHLLSGRAKQIPRRMDRARFAPLAAQAKEKDSKFPPRGRVSREFCRYRLPFAINQRECVGGVSTVLLT